MNRPPALRRAPVAATLFGALALATALAEDSPGFDRFTRAERTGFEETSSYSVTLDFLRQIEPRVPMKLEFFGTSAQGRPMPVVIVSGDRAFTPEAAQATGKPILMIQNGIHAGEIDGKDACLMLLRDLALGEHAEILDRLILLVVPIYNVDGHERTSPDHRPNQDGPVWGLGFRTTADGHDLNRDHVKADTPEARAILGLFNDWRPHLIVDNHVTDGVDHDWVLTYTWVESPQVAPSIGGWLQEHMKRVVAETERAGHRVGPYAALIDRANPSNGIDSYVGEPRYATGYYALRNRPSILVENHSYKPFKQRVLANRDFLLALFEEVAADPAALVDAVEQAERRTVSLGRADASSSAAVVRYRTADTGDRIRFPVYPWSHEYSQAMGVPVLRYERGKPLRDQVPWIHASEPEISIPRPRGYLVMPGWPVIEARLRAHGLQVRRVTRPARVEAESLRISNVKGRSSSSGLTYQGLTRIDFDLEVRPGVREIPAGSLWIPADQPDFEVAVQLLEPRATDSLVSWGLLTIATERKEYIEPRILEGLVRKQLEDPAVEAEWTQALTDETFASDAWARYIWWYRRTKHWDDTVGLLPYVRVQAPTPLSTAAWDEPGE